ncbi:hypothetical protein [Williamsia sp.]|uniref:hypothetical protein n=1 Tax=Williamsia sp. TaxID=1872085 RepID=UPI001A21A8C9|nr:hypothetical protein [Williamsia sp.]MBJ7289955.1 hypothetical protein [Williamsia sp.]
MPASGQRPPDDALPTYPGPPEGVESGSTSSASGHAQPVGRRWPWIATTLLGLVLAVAPLAGGMFYPAAQGRAMIADFAPYMTSQRLDGFTADLHRLDAVRSATTRIDTALGTDPAQYRQIAQFQQRYPSIDTDMTGMLTEIDGARDDYRRLSQLQPLDSIPFIPLGVGLVLLGAGIWGWRRTRAGRRPIGAAVVGAVAAVSLLATPLLTPMVADAGAAGPLVTRFDSVLTQQKVRDVQGYFVVLVGAVGEIDSRYLADVRRDSSTSPQRAQITADIAVVSDLSTRWQRMSSDFAGLIGTMNDNISNFTGVARLNSRTESLGFGTFAALPWVLIGAGGVAVALVAAGSVGTHRGRRAR